MQYNKQVIQTNKINSINHLHDVINDIMPRVIDYMNTGPKQLKKDNSLFKKDRDNIMNIINTKCNSSNYVIKEYTYSKIPMVTCYISKVGLNSSYLEFKTNYKVDEFSVSYIEKSYFLHGSIVSNREFTSYTGQLPEFKPLKSITITQVEKSIKKLNLLDEKIRDLKNQRELIKINLSTYFKGVNNAY